MRSNIPPREEYAFVKRVIDGDTIVVTPDRLKGRQVRVRYLCINAPDEGEPGYEDAKRANQDLVAGKKVKLVMDTTHLDRYKRYLRYVYVSDVFVNRELVKQGYAKATSFPPDDRYYTDFLKLQKAAARQGLGCHPTGVFEDEEQYVRHQTYSSQTDAIQTTQNSGRKYAYIIGALILVLIAFGFYALLPRIKDVITFRDASNVTAGDLAQVIRVIDGDTIEVLHNGARVRVRYVGMSTPERGKACFNDASEANSRFVDGKTVRLVRDTTNNDRYDRLLRYVYVGDVFVNRELVKQGFAEASLYQPDDMFFEEFRQLERAAAQAGLGCHPTGIFDDGSTTR